MSPRTIAWFSCGAASAVACKLIPESEPVYCETNAEHPDREQTAEWVGFYFGLQRAVNLKRLPEEFVAFLRAEMQDVEARLPPGTIDAWPRTPESE